MQMSCNDAAPVSIPTYEAGFHDAPKGGTPMGTPPSAKGIAAELPFAAGNFCNNNSQKNSDIGAGGHMPANHQCRAARLAKSIAVAPGKWP